MVMVVQGVIDRMQRGLWRLMAHMGTGRRRHTDSRGKAIGLLSATAAMILLFGWWFAASVRTWEGDRGEQLIIEEEINPLMAGDASIVPGSGEAKCGSTPKEMGVEAIRQLRRGYISLSAHCFEAAVRSCEAEKQKGSGSLCSTETEKRLEVWEAHTRGVLDPPREKLGRRIIHNVDAQAVPDSTFKPSRRMPDKSVMIWDNTVDKSICEAGIALFESGNQTQGLVTRGGVTLRDARFKVTEEVHLREASAVSQEFRKFELILLGLLTKHLIMYEAHNPGMLLLKSPLSDEGFRIKRYGNDSNHHHAYHVDSGDEAGSNHRVLAAILYLNDVQVGGETHLLQQGLSVKPKCGRLLLFPCAFTHLHAGARPVSSPKYDVVNFITVPL